MKDISDYKDKLKLLTSNLKQYDPNKADIDYIELKKMFDEVYKSGVLDIQNLPKEKTDIYKLELFTALTQISGSLGFLVIQILAANSIMTKNDYRKKDIYIQKKCGIAINHLRAPFTVVRGEKREGGYKLTGTLTWASGYKIFDTLLIGFHCDDKEYEALACFEDQDNFKIAQADKTFVGFGLNTVNIKLKEFFVKDEDIVSSKPMGHYTKQKSISKTVHFCLYGLGLSAVFNSIDDDVNRKALAELENLKNDFLASNDPFILDNLRVKLFLSVQSIITTAMVIKGGSSVLLNNNLQRLYKEVMMFNSNGLNDVLKELFKKRYLDA